MLCFSDGRSPSAINNVIEVFFYCKAYLNQTLMVTTNVTVKDRCMLCVKDHQSVRDVASLLLTKKGNFTFYIMKMFKSCQVGHS